MVTEHSKILFVLGNIGNGGADRGLDINVGRAQQADNELKTADKGTYLAVCRLLAIVMICCLDNVHAIVKCSSGYKLKGRELKGRELNG